MCRRETPPRAPRHCRATQENKTHRDTSVNKHSQTQHSRTVEAMPSPSGTTHTPEQEWGEYTAWVGEKKQPHNNGRRGQYIGGRARTGTGEKSGTVLKHRVYGRAGPIGRALLLPNRAPSQHGARPTQGSPSRAAAASPPNAARVSAWFSKCAERGTTRAPDRADAPSENALSFRIGNGHRRAGSNGRH